jgi:hypothetical protein
VVCQRLLKTNWRNKAKAFSEEQAGSRLTAQGVRDRFILYLGQKS